MCLCHHARRYQTLGGQDESVFIAITLVTVVMPDLTIMPEAKDTRGEVGWPGWCVAPRLIQ